MSPINGLSQQRRLPVLGTIHLGIKVPNKASDGEHPEATPYFVLPPELVPIYGKQCVSLPIMIPVEDDEFWCPQYYIRYSKTRGIVCKGDGITCRRMVDVKTGATADRNTKAIAWREKLPCAGKNCPNYKTNTTKDICKESMRLQFLLPDAPGLGVWQIISSINSILNINSNAFFIRQVYHRISFIPLMLTLEPKEVNNPEDGKKKTVRVLNIRVQGTMREIMQQASKPHTELMVPITTEEDAPLDDDVIEGECIETDATVNDITPPPASTDIQETPSLVLYGPDHQWQNLNEMLTFLYNIGIGKPEAYAAGGWSETVELDPNKAWPIIYDKLIKPRLPQVQTEEPAKSPATSAPQTKNGKSDMNAFFLAGRDHGLSGPQSLEKLGVKDWNEWVAKGGTLDGAIKKLGTVDPLF
jgi:hypothetical protein